MLILTRRVKETLAIDKTTKLTILGIEGNEIKLGIDAPKEIAVHREELYKRIDKDTQKEDVR